MCFFVSDSNSGILGKIPRGPKCRSRTNNLPILSNFLSGNFEIGLDYGTRRLLNCTMGLIWGRLCMVTKYYFVTMQSGFKRVQAKFDLILESFHLG